MQTISEAVRHIPDDWLGDYPTEPWGEIKAIGNRIRHEYFRLDHDILWQIITKDGPALMHVMQEMLNQHSSESASDPKSQGGA